MHSLLRAPLNVFCLCTELVASILKVGGLLDTNCNPGSATPEMLHRIYAPRAAVSANPVLLRELGTLSEQLAERETLVPPAISLAFQPARRRADSPPRGHFQVVGYGAGCSSRCATGGVQLTLNSLQFGSPKARLKHYT